MMTDQSTASCCAQEGLPYSHDARRAIVQLKALADDNVKTGFWLHVGEWLGWPDWMRSGTSLSGSGPLPNEISVADDLIVAANILAHFDHTELIRRFLSRTRPAFGPNAEPARLHAPNLETMLVFTARGTNLYNPHILAEYRMVGDELHYSIGFATSMGHIGNFLGILISITVAQMIRPMIYCDSASIQLQTTLSRHVLHDAVWAEFPWQVLPDSEVHRLVIPAHVAGSQNPEFDPTAWAASLERLELAEQLRDSSKVAQRIRSRISHMVSVVGQVPRLKQVATEEGLSERTIIRLFGAEGTTFHEIVDNERRQLAGRLICDADNSLDAIAGKLGFTDRSSFGRSFRKWYGMPPGRYRKEMVGSALVQHGAVKVMAG